MEEPEIIAIVGRNGSGKTRYVETLRRQTASGTMRYMAFCDTYGTATDSAYYLQLRWNQHDIDAETPLVSDTLERSFSMTGPDTLERRHLQQLLYQLFNMTPLLNKYIITLSSGELRKLQLIKTLMANPHTLILDNPFIGLDAATRDQLKGLLYVLAIKQHIKLYLVLSRVEDIPEYVTDFIWTTSEADFRHTPAPLSSEKRQALENMPASTLPSETSSPAPIVAQLNKVSIRYDDRVILDNIEWTVRQGEHWALSGQNGSGKSTLLSLICADNPQAYACDITLFGRQRGTGETIWDIKRHIGYVSPEMHRAYKHDMPAILVVASGLKDTVGLYVRANDEEKAQCRRWMWMMGIDHLADRPFLTLSSGEQRLVLLARAFVKEPDLLILDEPLHGLDNHNQQLAKDIIDAYCQHPDKTLIMVTHYESELPRCIDHYKQLPKQY